MRSSLYLTCLAAVLAQLLLVLQGALDLAQLVVECLLGPLRDLLPGPVSGFFAAPHLFFDQLRRTKINKCKFFNCACATPSSFNNKHQAFCFSPFGVL